MQLGEDLSAPWTVNCEVAQGLSVSPVLLNVYVRSMERLTLSPENMEIMLLEGSPETLGANLSRLEDVLVNLSITSSTQPYVWNSRFLTVSKSALKQFRLIAQDIPHLVGESLMALAHVLMMSKINCCNNVYVKLVRILQEI